jgi:hypothetical protein
MKRFLNILWLTIIFPLLAQGGVGHLLPTPQQVTTFNTGDFSLTRSISIEAPQQAITDPQINKQLQQLIESAGGSIATNAQAVIQVKLTERIAGAEFQDEAYHITVSTDTISISATTLTGAFWATQTLWQLANGTPTLQSCAITDWPAFRIRGYMHDVGRSFVQFEMLKNHIEKLSRYKINIFHWHLTENQGWRLESKIYPQLNANSSFERHHGQYYTIEQAKELVRFARQHGVTVLPEIDMPGHSAAFRKAMGHSMLTPDGLQQMKEIMTEACETFSETEWMHIGTDEVRPYDLGTIDWTEFVPVMVAHIRAQGKKVVSWNPGYHYDASGIDMTQMWSSSGRILDGVPAIDSRYHYINHFDMYSDVVALYNSTIAGQARGSHQYAGVIVGIWNDRLLPSDEAIVRQNNFYPSMLAIAERAWMGGGKGYFTNIGVNLKPSDTEFIDFERRFLHHKHNHLSGEPIDYVKQSNVRWRITDPFPNNGNLSATFPPETALQTSYTFNGQTYATQQAYGAGIYLRHVWGQGIIPAFYTNPPTNSTAYAFTYVYSPVQQQVGLQIEFQNYGRSESDLPPPAGQWDYNRSRIWINETEIQPPIWQNTHTSRSNEIPLRNENFTARDPQTVTLNEGWNKILLKLPVGNFSISQIRLVKWMFTCVFVTPDGRSEVENLIYSPDKNINPDKDNLISAIDDANSMISSVAVGFAPGQYRRGAVNKFKNKIEIAEEVSRHNNLTNEEYQQTAVQLFQETIKFKNAINMPEISRDEKTYWYSFSTPLRLNNGNNVLTWQGNNTSLKGEPLQPTSARQHWKFTPNPDGSIKIISRQDNNSMIHPGSAFNTALRAQALNNSVAGWRFIPTFTNSYFAVSSDNVQMNQTQSGLNFQIYNWGGGENITDAGCQFLLQLVAIDGADAADSLQLKLDELSVTLAGITTGKDPGYLSETYVNNLWKMMEEAEAMFIGEEHTLNDFRKMLSTLASAHEGLASAINLPLASGSDTLYIYAITVQRDNKSLTYQGDNQTLRGNDFVENNEKHHWKLKELQDGTLSICNANETYYIQSTSSGNPPTVITRAGKQNQGGWQFNLIDNGPWFTITAGNIQLNVSNAGTGYTVYNWGGGTNTTDTGCRFQLAIKDMQVVSSTHTVDIKNPLEKISIINNHLTGANDFIGLQIYSSIGTTLNQRSTLPKGIIIVKHENHIRKLINL